MDYKKIYDSIISKAKSENRKKGKEIYFESHHIIPICMSGDKNGKENRVLLTAKEHYVCHKILHWLNPNHSALALAYHSMAYMKVGIRKLKLTSREYEEVRVAHSIAITGENNPFYNKTHPFEVMEKIKETKNNKSQEEKDRINKQISESLSGENHPNYGKPAHPNVIEALRLYNSTKTVSQDVRDKISETLTGHERSDDSIQKQKDTIEKNGGVWNKGKTGIYSEESLKKNRQSHLGKKQSPDAIKKMIETFYSRPQEERDNQYKKSSEKQKGKQKNPVSVAKSTATRKRQRINKLPPELKLIEEEKLMMIF